MISKSEYIAIIRAGIDAVKHRGDFSGLTGFAEACYNDNTVADLLAALGERSADATDCKAWGITPTQWRAAIREALEARAYDFEEDAGIEGDE